VTSSPRLVRNSCFGFILAALAAACARSSGEPSAASTDTAVAYHAAEPAPPPYRVIDVSDAGTLRGTITLSAEAEVRGDTVVRMIRDQDVCGATMRIPLVRHRGDQVEGVIVWLADARRGKPLPIDRRFDIATEQCALEPKVQAAIVGGTLNVFNGDPASHRSRFLVAGTDSTIALVRETDSGQVVPIQSVLARPGLVEVRCDIHPYTRGWIRVFDQPYFDVTDRRGRFSLESVPPGTYHLVAWHPRLGTIRRTVTVQAGAAVTVDLTF
jgi:hypothetical protein